MSTVSYIYGGLSANTITASTIVIKSVATGTSIASLGVDASGNIVSGATGGVVSGSTAYLTSGSSGTDSIKAVNTTSLNATGDRAVAFGNNTLASGNDSFAQNAYTTAYGWYSHAEGYVTTAIGNSSHAGGTSSIAFGESSFIHSTDSIVTGVRSAVIGGLNITGSTDDTVYVPYLNVQNVGSGTSLFNLGIDSTGNIVTGTTDVGGNNLFSASDLGFNITPKPSVIINQNVILPPNCDVTYPSPLIVGSGYSITIPSSTTLTII